MKDIEKKILTLIGIAELLGLDSNDVKNAKEHFEYNEYEVCFNLIITQLDEHDIEIDNNLYLLICDIGEKMKLPSKEYIFMKELIRDGSKIPESVKRELGKILDSLNT